MSEPVTNDTLLTELAEIRQEVARAPETLAALVHDHEKRIPHSGISADMAAMQITRVDELAETNRKLISLLDGPAEPDWRGIPVHRPEKGLLARLTRIEQQTNGDLVARLDRIEGLANTPTKIHLDAKAWGALLATLAATLIQIFTR